MSELRRRNVFRMAVLYIVAAWLVMQVTEVLMTLVGLPLWSGQAVLAVLVLGFPIALIFSWLYEITPEGISLEKDVDRAKSITHVTGRRLDFIVISLLAAAVLVFAYDKWWTSPPPELSIAIMAFENMSADPEQEYFSDGMSEDLLNLLAQVPGLKVISRSSAFSFKGKDVPIPTIAKQLNVTHVLEGSVRRFGNQLRVTAQLIETSTDTHLWSESYDRELENTFAVQDEIAAAVVEALGKRLGLPGTPTPRANAAKNPEAHDAYLRGRFLLAQRTRATVADAVREFEKAIALDSGYAPAHAQLVIASIWSSQQSRDPNRRAHAIAKATSHIEKAMTLDPNLAETYAANGYLLWFQWHEEEALQHFKQAIEINPNYAIVYAWMATVNGHLGQYSQVWKFLEAGMRLDPLSIVSIYNYTFILIETNRLSEAEQHLEILESMSPLQGASMRGMLTSIGGNWANLVLGNLDALLIEADNEQIRSRMSSQFILLGLEKEAHALQSEPNPFLLSVFGRPADAVEAAEARLAKESTHPYNRYMLGQTLAMAGDYKRAQPMQEEYWQQADGRVTRSGAVTTIDAAALIAIRRSAGDEEGAREVLAAMKENVRRYREAGIVNAARYTYRNRADFEDGLTLYLAGEHEKGLALIGKAVEDGDFILPNMAYLQALYDDPGYIPIRDMMEARQAHERKRFLAVVCTDNPYAAVWQPEEGTCAKYVAGSSN